MTTNLWAQTYVVGISENKPLKGFNGQDEPSGIFVELLNYIAEEENWDLKYKSLSFLESQEALKSGEIDIMPDLGYSEQRNKLYSFNKNSVMLSWGQVYCQDGIKINSLLDLKNKKIAVVKGGYFSHNNKDGFFLIASQFNLNCTYVFAEGYDEVFELIKNKKVDAGIVNRMYGDYNFKKIGITKTPVVFSPIQLHFAFPKDEKYQEVIDKIDFHLDALKNDNKSIYYQLIEDYFYVKEVSVVPLNFKILVITILLILLATITFIYALRTTVKVRTKELNKALEKAKESDKLKSVFLRNLSHEVRTPMNGINGFSLLLQDEDLDNTTRKRYTDLVLSSTQQLLSIVENILSISLLETRQENIKISNVNVNEILDDLYLIFSKSLDEKNVDFTLKKEFENNKAVIKTDHTKFRQILSNLVGNAVKFTAKGAIEFGYNLKSNFLEFYIKDSGIGIDMRLKDQIFTLFSQEDNSSKRRYEGAGLGLSIAKGYVELLGGEIYFDSEKEKGTTFYFTIPYNT